MNSIGFDVWLIGFKKHVMPMAKGQTTDRLEKNGYPWARKLSHVDGVNDINYTNQKFNCFI